MELEASLFVYFGQRAAARYKQKARDICFNLLDGKNLDFRYAVLNKDISPSELCTLEPKQMASAAMNAFRQEREENRSK